MYLSFAYNVQDDNDSGSFTGSQDLPEDEMEEVEEEEEEEDEGDDEEDEEFGDLAEERRPGRSLVSSSGSGGHTHQAADSSPHMSLASWCAKSSVPFFLFAIWNVLGTQGTSFPF